MYLSEHKNLLSMAWASIAAILLPRFPTMHRAFKLPIDLDKFEAGDLKTVVKKF